MLADTVSSMAEAAALKADDWDNDDDEDGEGKEDVCRMLDTGGSYGELSKTQVQKLGMCMRVLAVHVHGCVCVLLL
jgi:hypothetical protein